MSTHELNLNDARKKRPSTVMSDEEKKEILDYLKDHENDQDAIPYLMKKHNCSQTTIGIIAMKDIMKDDTENIRRKMVKDINQDPNGRIALEQEYGQVWDTNELSRDFEVLGFMAPFAVARRKSDGVKGSLKFQHSPRFYFSFEPDKG